MSQLEAPKNSTKGPTSTTKVKGIIDA